MPSIFSKLVKIGLWTLVPVLLISGVKLDDQKLLRSSVYGDYVMQVSGNNLNENLSGIIKFETAIETTSRGVSFSTLKLKLINEKDSPHSMEFLVSKEMKRMIPKGLYKVSGSKEGFLNYFNGVFGFANINALGELPLFADSGTIQISHIDKSTVKGTLNVRMRNTTGRSIRIKGNFTATN